MTPIVLVPGLLCTAEIFGPQLPALWPYGPVTVASTMEGATMAEIAASILASAPPQFALAGISMGGYVAFEMMRQAPERVVKLALLDTSAHPDTPEQTMQRRALMAQAPNGSYKAFIKHVLRAILHPSHQADAEMLETMVRMGAAIGVDGFIRQMEAIIGRQDSRPTLSTITVPTLVLVGDSDPLTSPERSHEIALRINGSRLVVVPDCGHASTLEKPAEVNQALVEWIST